MIKAYSPGNISCIFRIINDKNPAKMHSLGVGFTTYQGVIASASFNKKNIVFFNDKRINFPAVESVVGSLNNGKKNIRIDIKSKLPLGAGFGLSGASSLATAYAVNKLLNLRKSKKSLAMIAHIAEVKNKTGLGDVGGQFNGGFNAKLHKGAPLKVIKLNIEDKTIYYRFFSRLKTKGVLNDKELVSKINHAGDAALNKIKRLIKNRKANLKDIINISEEFSIKSGLLKDKKVVKTIKMIKKKGGNASMIMLGNAVFSDIRFKGSKKIKVSDKGACLL